MSATVYEFALCKCCGSAVGKHGFCPRCGTGVICNRCERCLHHCRHRVELNDEGFDFLQREFLPREA
jgi:hypothetical protein